MSKALAIKINERLGQNSCQPGCLVGRKKKRPKGFKGFATFLAPSQLGVCDVVNLESKKEKYSLNTSRGSWAGGRWAWQQAFTHNMLPTFWHFQHVSKDWLYKRVCVCVWASVCVCVWGFCLCMCVSLCFCRFSALTFALIFDSCLGGRARPNVKLTHTPTHTYTHTHARWKQ